MEKDSTHAIKKVFVQVLEEYAFLFGDVIDSGAPLDASPPYHLAGMGFRGPFAGRLSLAVPGEFCAQVAANVLGLDADDPMAVNGRMDALKELLNVTCGNLLTVLAGEEPVFDLTVPEVTELSAAEWRGVLAEPGAVAFLVEEWPVALRLTLGEAGMQGED